MVCVNSSSQKFSASVTISKLVCASLHHLPSMMVLNFQPSVQKRFLTLQKHLPNLATSTHFQHLSSVVPVITRIVNHMLCTGIVIIIMHFSTLETSSMCFAGDKGQQVMMLYDKEWHHNQTNKYALLGNKKSGGELQILEPEKKNEWQPNLSSLICGSQLTCQAGRETQA